MGVIGQIHPRYQVDAKIDAVSALFAEVRAQYGAAFDAALGRDVADALAVDVGSGVDRISIGALAKHVRATDYSMRIV
jgi:nicotinate-nucleotide pyrophosphorylase (carboxylating)